MNATEKATASGLAAIAAATGLWFLAPAGGESPATTAVTTVATTAAATAVDLSGYMPEIPAVAVPAATLPDTTLPETAPLDAGLPDMACPSAGAEAALPAVPDAGIAAAAMADLRAAAALDAECQAAFRDRRSIGHDMGRYDGGRMEAWLRIYREYAGVVPERIPLGKPVRMISEVRLPGPRGSLRILRENLAFYRSRGYDSALLTFDSSESPEDLAALARVVLSEGLAVWLAYGGPESLAHTAFIDPALLRRQIQAVAALSSGMLLAWRRTSAHLFLQDAPFMAYLAACAREANPRLPIVGELYYGSTAVHPDSPGWGANCPEWASGVLAVNFGYLDVEPKKAVAAIRRQCPGLPVLALVVGHRPYYLTVRRNGLPPAQNLRIKEFVERRLSGAGAAGTVTFHDDGRDGVGGGKFNNNLADTPVAELK